ncbi:MAG TPA: cytochrome c [Thermomicrobiales bacterium]|nr:cytochrome c [Thermomicrobiales bacterium]
MRKRGSILAITFLSVLIVVVACGRASEDDINNALGIEPTATLSDEQIAQATKASEAAASAIASGASPAAADSGIAAIMQLGDITLGQQRFSFQCIACHKADGTGPGPALTGPDSPVVDMTDEQVYALVRDGAGHTGQQPVSTVIMSDKQLASIILYIRDQIANPDS